jgi:hypothetical protein
MLEFPFVFPSTKAYTPEFPAHDLFAFCLGSVLRGSINHHYSHAYPSRRISSHKEEVLPADCHDTQRQLSGLACRAQSKEFAAFLKTCTFASRNPGYSSHAFSRGMIYAAFNNRTIAWSRHIAERSPAAASLHGSAVTERAVDRERHP